MSVHRVTLLALDAVLPLDLAIPAQIFGPREDSPYRLTVCGIGGVVSTTTGFSLSVPGDLRDVPEADTVIVPGYAPHRRVPPAALDALREARLRGRRLVSICTGAFALAEAGLLDGRRATTHWQNTGELARDFPLVTVDADVLYVDDGDVLTSAGVSCGIDLCLHIVRRDLGAERPGYGDQPAAALSPPLRHHAHRLPAGLRPGRRVGDGEGVGARADLRRGPCTGGRPRRGCPTRSSR